MSFLAPFYLLGALAIAAPILWHLIRRRPKSPVEFSSLMFLRPSPPRITRRSRLENLPLLLLRILALLLLAAAFARPLFRGAADTTTSAEGRRVVVLVDTSASMRRDGLWEAAQSRVAELVDDIEASDSLAIVAYDATPRVLWSFDTSARTAAGDRAPQVASVMQSLAPSWLGSDLGAALSFAADYAQNVDPAAPAGELASPPGEPPDPDVDASAPPLPVQIHLVSDLQNGSRTTTLQSYTWPDRTQLEVHPITSPASTNASLRVIEEDSTSDASESELRVRVSNSVGASESTFTLTWQSAEKTSGAGLPIQVPPGESRVVRVPLPQQDAQSLVIAGDDHDFDNRWYLVPPEARRSTVLFFGSEPESRRESLLYYLQQVPLDRRYHEVALERRDPASLIAPIDPEMIPLVVIGDPLPSTGWSSLADYARRGGRVLWVLEDSKSAPDDAAALRQLGSAEALQIGEAVVSDYSLFQRIDFDHELFAPMADPRFNDFSKIRTWAHRRVSGYPDAWKVVVQFDSGDPALLETTIGEGRLWVLTMGWQPQSSQLALSTKFAPLVIGMVRSRDAARFELASYEVGAPIPESWNGTEAPGEATWITDDGRFAQPGVWERPDGEGRVAVNGLASESDTAPLPVEQLERLGVNLGTAESEAEQVVRHQRIRDVELEQKQNLWQWGILGALGLIGLESLLAGWKSRWQPNSP